MSDCFVGVDVGTGSCRGALVTCEGKVLNVSVEAITTWNPLPDHYEQSSNEIWQACLTVIKNVIRNVNPNSIKGIGFDATCSLVVLDKEGLPLTISTTGENEQNVILWMDHRAKDEAALINETNHPILQYVGGKVSLEMEIPKLMWLKKNLPKTWNASNLLFDLPDFLTWKATGSESRSLCSTVCKWNYEHSLDGHHGWNNDYFHRIGLSELLEDDCKKIGKVILAPGVTCGKGLSQSVSAELGLNFGTPVGTSIIDAHAGGLGMIGARAENVSLEMSSRVSLICGTSTCHMAVNPSPIHVAGVWGPYYSAMVPGLWLNEAGQSASGYLVEYIIKNHRAFDQIQNKLQGKRIVQDYLQEMLHQMSDERGLKDVNYLTENLHIWPDFHGNRSPLADPEMKGMMSGLTLSSDEENLAMLYLSTLQALAYGTRHILEALIDKGYKDFESLLICGGLSSDSLYVKIQADAVGLPILKPEEKESVLIGAAILGACGANYFRNIQDATSKMCGKAAIILPDPAIRSFHDKKYKVFLKMYKDQMEYKNIMEA